MTSIDFLYTIDLRALLREAIEATRPTSSTTLLNIACERDLASSFLAARITPQNIRGIDIDPDIVRSDVRIRYCDVDRDRFPFEDASFDLALSVWGMEHFQTSRVFHEARRVLKPGGRLILVTPNLAHPIFLASKLGGEKCASWYYRRIIRSSYKSHAAFYRFNTLGALRYIERATALRLQRVAFFGPASVLGYFSFSPFFQRVISFCEKWFLTNPFFDRFKPYLLAVFERPNKSIDGPASHGPALS